MLPDLSEIKQKRKQLGLSQNELAQKTSISQSTIAKIEAQSLSPSYENAKKLFDFFESIKEQSSLKAGEMMTHKVITVPFDTTVKDAIVTMKKNNISQMPILENHAIIGMVSEKLIVDKMQKEKNLEEFTQKKVHEIMDESPPQITEQTKANAVSALLENNPAVLVIKKGKIDGIISRSDLLNSLIKPQKKAPYAI